MSEARAVSAPTATETASPAPVFIHPTPENGSERLSEPSDVPDSDVGDVDCGSCGLWFTSMAAYDRHRDGRKCLLPTECGLVVSPRIRLTWSIPVRVPVSVDVHGNVTEWLEVDREIAASGMIAGGIPSHRA